MFHTLNFTPVAVGTQHPIQMLFLTIATLRRMTLLVFSIPGYVRSNAVKSHSSLGLAN